MASKDKSIKNLDNYLGLPDFAFFVRRLRARWSAHLSCFPFFRNGMPYNTTHY